MTRQLSRPEAATAVLSWKHLHDIAAAIPTQRTGRPRHHPLALHLAWGALARIHGAGNRLDIETADRPTWHHYLATYNHVAATHPLGETVDPDCERLTSNTYRHIRDTLVSDEHLETLSTAFTAAAINQAHSLGLITSTAGGSLTHPSPRRVIYGDGTIVRPLYRNREVNGRRIDTDAEEHTRHDGKIIGNNIVFVATRGPEQHRRVILAVGRVDAPGREAAMAVELLSKVIRAAGGGVQAVVYDGALRGGHHHTLMDRHGVVVINKVHPATHVGDERTYRTIPLGTWTHRIGRRDCAHHLVAHHGDIHDAVTTDDGTIALSPPLSRTQIRRHPRVNGTWRMNLGVNVPCRRSPFTAWLNPHPLPTDRNAGRTDQLRLIPESLDEFDLLYGLRNDAEAINSEFKRTLVVDRAPALGWRRQVLAAMSWGIHNNARAAWLHNPKDERPAA
ncbi:hypothetical protein BH10ACT3_BH10ACT3_05030 [soil metagenome]